MNITLVDLHTESDGNRYFFDADLWIDGKKAGYVTYIDGASVTIRANDPTGSDLIEAARQYCLTLPALQVNDEDGKSVKVDMDLENYIFKKVLDQQATKQKPLVKPKQPMKQGRNRGGRH
jgi:hypothetical protein